MLSFVKYLELFTFLISGIRKLGVWVLGHLLLPLCRKGLRSVVSLMHPNMYMDCCTKAAS